MPIERSAPGTSYVDALDRILDKGIVIDVWVRVSLIGIGLITVQARVVVASIQTYLYHADSLAHVEPSTLSATLAGSLRGHVVHPALERESTARTAGLPLLWSWS